MRRNYGYDTYRGKSKFRTFLKIIIAVLAIILVLLVGAFFFLQRYMVVSADGVRFELPFGSKAETPSPSLPLTVESLPPVVTDTPSPSPSATPTYTRAVSFSSDLLSGGALQALYAEGGSALAAYTGGNTANAILTMKNTDGLLGYISNLTLAKEVRSSSGEAARNGDIQALTAPGGPVYAAAYVSCFRDNTAPYQNNRLALRTTIGNWRGPGDIRWMSPAVAEARQYVTDICGELANLGFREILLDNAAFPTTGELTRIVTGERYSPAAFETTVSQFYLQVRQTLDNADSHPILSVVTDKTTLDEGRNPLSGQSLESLCKYADRLYADLGGADPSAYYEKLKLAGMKDPESNLVVLLSAAPAGEVAYSWAVLPT